MRGLCLGFTSHVRTRGVLDVCLCLGCGGVGVEWVGCLKQSLEGWGGVMSVSLSLEFLCRSQVQVSVYYARWIPAHLFNICIQHVTNISDSILIGDVNALSTLWYSHPDDHRGQLISDIISNIILNTDTPPYNKTLHQTS